ncbi:MAG: hypothetical protein KKA73_08505 [Chloroflexi bacterium]|nr:hypothetical protein [Chloroflexota bacterium]MBU1747717.1 hypothetical protein [Chloroflexota bacterium]
MKRRWWMAGLALIVLAMLGTGCDVIVGPGTVAGTVRYAKDPTGALDDPQNAGEPAAGVKVLIYGVNLQDISSEGTTVYMANQEPNLELVTDEQGRYTTEIASGHYVVRLAPDPKTYHRLVDVGPWRTSTVDFVIRRPASGTGP